VYVCCYSKLALRDDLVVICINKTAFAGEENEERSDQHTLNLY
jgi:hypothetical protein